MADATFEEGGELPLYIKALDAGSIQVVSALSQDAVFPITEMTYEKAARRFAVLLNRFRWEDKARAEQQGRPFERVQSLLVIEDVTKVASQGIDRSDKDMVLSLMSLSFEPGEDGTGRIGLTLAGDGAIALDVECIDVALKDVTKPYVAPSGHAPEHGD